MFRKEARNDFGLWFVHKKKSAWFKNSRGIKGRFGFECSGMIYSPKYCQPFHTLKQDINA